MWQTEDLNIKSRKDLISPCELKQQLPITDSACETVLNGRKAIKDILSKQDKRMFVIVGPCSIHDTKAALEYARKLSKLRNEVEKTLYIVMRVYFEKPRTTVGWKGLINDPHLDESYDINTGLYRARELLITLAEMGIPTATEVLDPIVPQYIADLLAWGAIGARTTESQQHREMASGLSMPVGFKNGTDGNLEIAMNAILSARQPHHFLGLDQNGKICVIETLGNSLGHIILRGGNRPNYDPVSVAKTKEQLRSAGLEESIVVDCSHANCGKHHALQAHVLHDIIRQRLGGNSSLIGIMLESNLEAGNQDIPRQIKDLRYGVSITDPCLGWSDTSELIKCAALKLSTT